MKNLLIESIIFMYCSYLYPFINYLLSKLDFFFFPLLEMLSKECVFILLRYLNEMLCSI